LVRRLCTSVTNSADTVKEEIAKPEEHSRINEAALSQPATTALQIAFVILLEKYNIRPARVCGHSSGEIAAAFAAGYVDFHSCLAIAYYRGVAATELASIDSFCSDGAMMAVGAEVSVLRPLLNSLTSGVANIACYNSPRSLTVSGDAAAISELKQHLDKLGVFNRLLRVRTAYHSDHMGLVVDRYLENLGKFITPITTSERKCTFHSSVTTSVEQPAIVASPTYWALNLVSPVQFSHTLRRLLAAAHTEDMPPVIIEIGPHAALRGPIREICTDYSSKNKTSAATYLPSLQRGKTGYDDILELWASLVNIGQPVKTKNASLESVTDSPGKMLTDLPTYQFNLDSKYWHSSRLQTAKLRGGSPWNAILGHKVDEAIGDVLQFRHVFTLDDIPWLVDHQVEGSVVFPMAGYVSAVVEALNHHRNVEASSSSIVLREVVIDKAFLVSAENNNELMTILRPQRADTRSAASMQSFAFELLSWTERTGFVEHCRGFAKVTAAEDANLIGGSNARQLESRSAHQLQSSLKSSCSRTVLPSKLYEAASRRGLSYGPTFQGVTSMHTGPLGAHGTLRAVDTAERMPSGYEPRLLIHPAWLDAALHVGLCNLGGNEGDPDHITAHVPTFLKEVKIQLPSTTDLTCQAEVFVHNIETSAAASSTQADIAIFHPYQATPTLQIRGLRMFQTSDASSTNDTLEADTINPLTVGWLPYPEFPSSLIAATTKIGDEEEEQSRRRDLERLSLDYMVDALIEVSQRPQSLHLGKLYDWMQSETILKTANTKHARRTEWLTCNQEERLHFRNTFAEKWPDCREWMYVGSKLPMILREEINPLEVLMKDNMLFEIYERSTIFQRSFRQLAELVDLLSRRNPWLRILEVGAGTGGCTSRILEKITSPTTRFESYDYTDISSGFFEAARTKFRTTGGKLNFLKLDICADIEQQGFLPGSYDLVIAADVIHATPDLALSLRNIRKLLKPTGSLALVELSSCTPYMFLFATLPGWWYRGHEDGAFVPEQEWQDLLVGSGFNGVEASLKDHPEDHQHYIIWSRPKPTQADSPVSLTLLDDAHTAIGCSSSLAAHCSKALGAADIRFGRLTDCQRESGSFICLHELRRPLLAHPTNEEFGALQRLFETATEILWVVNGDGSQSEIEQSLFDFAFGFARSVRREYAGTKFVVLQLHDTDSDSRMSSISAIYKHCFVDNAGNNDVDMDYRVKDGIVQFPRLMPHRHMADLSLERAGQFKTEERAFACRDRPLQLQMTHAGSLETMVFEQPAELVSDGRPLGPRELLIEIKGTGLNFKDILIALGSLPWQGLGRECCGVVVEVGRDLVSQFQIGDTVLHWGTGLFASHARCHVDTVAKAPANLGSGEAAAVPVVFGTVYECLINVARLEQGESILIHAAAGGVGQAAIMIARYLGAEMYCTVGTPEKKALLMDVYGIPEDHIFSSRSPSFADSLLLATEGKGVDVVLNSLSDEMFQSTWKCVSMFGRFIDIGKKQFVSNARLELNPFDNSITYSSVDLSLLIEHRGPYVQKLMVRVVDLFNKGVLKPPSPVQLISASDIQGAFRSMQSGKVVGKIVIVNDATTLVAAKVQPIAAARIRSEGTYIITGGTGGLGRALAGWLIELGARYIVLVSRSGGDQSPDSELNTLVNWASKKDAKVFVAACDVSESTKVDTLLKTLAANHFPSPSGVIHGAMVLEVSPFSNET
jgi:NADPH:quinone reductase-like Zn-dependent oxidoreductase/malonyl CoA-acyl carrier protein transacylase